MKNGSWLLHLPQMKTYYFRHCVKGMEYPRKSSPSLPSSSGASSKPATPRAPALPLTDPNALTSRPRPSINEVKPAFGQGDLSWKPGHLHSAYGAICCHKFKPKNMTDDVFLAEILGHKLLGSNASLSIGQSYKKMIALD
jgi:hypothetical protein